MKVTKWSTFTGGFDVSDQNAEQSSGESGSLLSGSAAPEIWDAQGILSPATPPDEAKETTRADAPHLQGPEFETDASAPPPAAESDVSKVGALDRSEVVTMSVGNYRERKGASTSAASESKMETSGRHRSSALAAMVALATAAGVLGGALATVGFSHFARGEVEVANSSNSALEASVARIDADIQALKSSIEHTAKLANAQSGKAGERLDRLEKAQAEPAAKLARLSEAVEKLRAAAPAAAAVPIAAPPNAQNAAKEVTGSIASSAGPNAEIARLPAVAGWKLRDVANGGALIESRQGLYEVYAGDAVPGLGRIDAIRRQDGRWVVVTAKGLVVPR
jgi:hypothetical protein